MISKFNTEDFLGTLAKANPNTAIAYSYDIVGLRDKIKSNLCAVTEAEFEVFKNELLDEGKSHATINRYGATLNKIFKVYGINRKIAPNLGKDKTLKTVFIPPNVINNMIKAMDTTNAYTCRDTLLIAILYATGMKVSDVLSLRLRDITPVNLSHVEIKDARLILPVINLRGAFDKYLLASRNMEKISFLFYSKKSKSVPVNRKSAWRSIQILFEEFKLDVAPSDLRHSYAYNLVDQGVTPKDVAGYLNIEPDSAMIYFDKKRRKNLK